MSGDQTPRHITNPPIVAIVPPEEDTINQYGLRRVPRGDQDDEKTDLDDTLESFKVAKERWITLFERDYILTALKRSKYNISHAAREAAIDRKYFRKLMQKYDIEIP
jgi:DNA-binding NtrC family response regulator